MAADADHPTRTLALTLTGTLWGDLCLDAVACEGSRLIRPKGDAVDGGYVFYKKLKNVTYFKTRTPGCAYIFFVKTHHIQ